MMINIILNKLKKNFCNRDIIVMTIIAFISVVLLVFCICKLNSVIHKAQIDNIYEIRYDLKVPINQYNIRSKKEAYSYYNYLISHIKPKELQKYDDRTAYYDIDFMNPNFKLKGNDFIEPMICYAYNNFITHYLFQKEFVVKKEEPLSHKFLKKFNKGVSNYFNLKNEIEMHDFSARSQTFRVVEYVNIPNPLHDTEFVEIALRQLNFKYMIDGKGYIDDLVIVDEKRMLDKNIIEIFINKGLLKSIDDVTANLSPGCNINDYITSD